MHFGLPFSQEAVGSRIPLLGQVLYLTRLEEIGTRHKAPDSFVSRRRK